MRIASAILPALILLTMSAVTVPQAKATVLGSNVTQPATRNAVQPVYYYKRHYHHRGCYHGYRNNYRKNYYYDNYNNYDDYSNYNNYNNYDNYGYRRNCCYGNYERSYSRHYRNYDYEGSYRRNYRDYDNYDD